MVKNVLSMAKKRPIYGVSTVCLRSSCSQFPRLHSIEEKIAHKKHPKELSQITKLFEFLAQSLVSPTRMKVPSSRLK